MQSKSGEIILAIVVGIAVISAGFALITGQHNALVLEARDGGAAVGARVDKIKWHGGVGEAIAANPGQSTLAVLVGTAAGYATYKSGGGGSKGDTTTINQTGNGNTYGGRDVTESRTTTTTTSSGGQ